MDDLERARLRAMEMYPRIADTLKEFNLSYGKSPPGGEDRGLEFYPPWETDNPTKGKPHIQIFNRGVAGDELATAIAGDAMHLLGSVDPRTGEPINPGVRLLKDNLRRSLTSEQLRLDQKIHKQTKDPRPFEDWMDISRTDAYIRGYLFPDAEDEWRKQEVYTPEQVRMLESLRSYLTTPSKR